ncbi:MAG: ABC transporter ATP-binding protein [Maricaulis sp.]|nr:ABC transporter ATP-binding protein [Maricaulis sp.]MDG2044153.1 ABC transporter ATP-binding protein [Maricaulis sp.]
MSDQKPLSTKALAGRLWRDWLAPKWPLVTITVILAAITAGAVTSYGKLIQWTFDLLNLGDASFFPIAPLAVIGLAIIRSTSLYLQTVQTNRLALGVMEDIQNQMFAKFVHADFARLQSEPVGKLVSRFTNDITLLRETLVRLFNNLMRDSLTVLGAVGFMLAMDWMLTILILVVYPIAFYPVIKIGERLRKTSASAQSQMGEVTSLVEESFSGTRMVKTYGLEDNEAKRARKSFAERFRLLLKITENKARVDPILEIVGGAAFAGLIAFAGLRLIEGQTSIGNIIGILVLLAVLSPAVRALGTLNAVVQEGFAVLQRVFDVLDEEETITSALDAPSLKVESGHLALADVHFAYPDGTPALRGVSIKAAPGKTVALVGASGSGKSTVLNLIPRLYDATSGRVQIDNNDVRAVSLTSLRQSLALVSQDVTLFNDTIRANIAFGKLDASDDEIIAAAKSADAHDFIMETAEGYDSPVGQRGGNLSGGQRQRLSIARAILKDAPILLLDEATSALDTKSERRVQEALEHLSKGRTTLVIAHRLSTIRNADWIYVMEDGQVVEEGRHDDLVARAGTYSKLCEMQFGADEDSGK